MNAKIRYGLSAAVLALIAVGAPAPDILDQFLDEKRDKALAWVEKNIRVPLTEPQKAGIASFCPYNIGPGKCFPSTFYKRLNAGDRKGACEAIRWWIKDGGRDCRIRSNNCYGQVIRRDQESALACWGIEQ
ncbi:MAG: glycoside hydrolase family protein [Escherichia coli]|nr:glycoside hydrolase family protein [Escherichia coli]